MTTNTHSLSETKLLAKKFGESLTGGEVIGLYGDLGVGKTSFVQGLAKGLGISDSILSPTFVLHRSHKGRLGLEHLDFYRLEKKADLDSLGLGELLGQPDKVVAIEWPDRVGFNHPKIKKIYFKFIDENTREITSEDLS